MKHRPITFLILALTATPLFGQTKEPLEEKAPPPLVYQIPIRNPIEPALLYVIRRGVREATREKADAIIFKMDTPGGRVDITRDILEIIRKIDVPVYTFVERDAYSAGAIIALATPHIYMAPGSVIGAATPILMGPGGGIQDLNEDVSEKMKSGVAAMVRAAAEQGGHDPALAEAMVRREMEYVVGTNMISKAGELLTLTASEAEGVLSDGTVGNLEALLVAIGLPNADVKTLEVTPSEKFARVIAGLAPILLMNGLGGIYLEIKTPGFGIPGIAGASALVLFFFGHHIAGLAGMEDVVLFIIGFTLLFIEVFVTPGFGVLGISGMTLLLVSLLNAMSWRLPGEFLPALSGSGATLQHAMMNLSLGLAGTVLLGVIVGRYLPKSHLVTPLILASNPTQGSEIRAAHDLTELLGEKGIAEMNLHPAGRGVFTSGRANVITQGEFIQKGASIQVIEVHGSRIVVQQTNEEV